MRLRAVGLSPICLAPISTASSFTRACPSPRCDAHDDYEKPIKRANYIVKYRHNAFEDVRRNRDYRASEPWAKERAGIASVKEAMPDTPHRILRTS